MILRETFAKAKHCHLFTLQDIMCSMCYTLIITCVEVILGLISLFIGVSQKILTQILMCGFIGPK